MKVSVFRSAAIALLFSCNYMKSRAKPMQGAGAGPSAGAGTVRELARLGGHVRTAKVVPRLVIAGVQLGGFAEIFGRSGVIALGLVRVATAEAVQVCVRLKRNRPPVSGDRLLRLPFPNVKVCCHQGTPSRLA